MQKNPQKCVALTCSYSSASIIAVVRWGDRKEDADQMYMGASVLLTDQREAAPQEFRNRIHFLTNEKCILQCALLAAASFKIKYPQDSVMLLIRRKYQTWVIALILIFYRLFSKQSCKKTLIPWI